MSSINQISLKAVIAGALEISPIELSETSGMNMTENWDSLRQLLIITDIERTFSVKLPFAAVERANSIGEIRAVLHSLGVAPAD